jgi:HEPN domain-containing protein
VSDESPPPKPTSPAVPSPQTLRRAKLFWEQAGQDHRAARERQRAGAPLEAAYLSFQAALNALTVVCYLNGRFQLPNFSTVRMAAQCAELDARFEAVRESCETLEAVQERGPFDAEPDPDALAALGKASLAQSDQVVEAVRAYLKEHRKRFFAP